MTFDASPGQIAVQRIPCRPNLAYVGLPICDLDPGAAGASGNRRGSVARRC